MTMSLTKSTADLGMVGVGTVIDDVKYINPTARIYHNCVIRSGVTICGGSVIGHLVVIERDTFIGCHTTIQSQCHITAEAVIGDNCFFGPGVMTMNEKNIANRGRTTPKIEKLKIGHGVRIGTGAIIAPGIKIGDNAFISAGSFVTKNVPANEVWGNPRNGSRAVKLGIVPEGERL